MKYANDNTANSDRGATEYQRQVAFKARLAGYAAMGGVARWSADNYIDRAAMERPVNRSHKIRARYFSALLSKSCNWIRQLGSAYAEGQRTRRNVMELKALTNRELLDIGISRGDISAIAGGAMTVAELNNRRQGQALPRHEQVAEVSSILQWQGRHCRRGECTADIYVDHAA